VYTVYLRNHFQIVEWSGWTVGLPIQRTLLTP